MKSVTKRAPFAAPATYDIIFGSERLLILDHHVHQRLLSASSPRIYLLMTSERDETPKWNGTEGNKIIQDIAVEHTPWKNGLRDYQLDVVSEVLDGTNFFYIDATGFGKSRAFSFPIITLLQYNKNPDRYPRGYRTKKDPVGIVVTPTPKGLAYNLVRGQYLWFVCGSL
jgi:hypothetical protein